MKKVTIWFRPLILTVCVWQTTACTVMDSVTTVAAGWVSEVQTSDELWVKLKSHATLSMPNQAEAITPLVVMAPGCLGWRNFHNRWRSIFLSAGYAVLHVDSFAARGLTDPKAIEAVVCEGKGIYGFERAGDIAVTLEKMEFPASIDRSNIVLAGWSNGGWAVWDLLHFVNLKKRPPNLSDWNPPSATQFTGIISFYPYCGFGSHSYSRSLPESTQALVFVGTDDESLPPEPCRQRMTRLRDNGAKVEFIEYKGVTHWFDNYTDFDLLPHRYDPEATEDAKRRILELLSKLKVR